MRLCTQCEPELALIAAHHCSFNIETVSTGIILHCQTPSLPPLRNNMAQNLAGKLAEKALGHGNHERAATTDVSNPDREAGKYADKSGERMKALVWMGKNDVRVRRFCNYFSYLYLPN